MFQRIEHTALSVSDMGTIRRLLRHLIWNAGRVRGGLFRPASRQINGLTGCKAKVVHLKLGETVLELFQYREPQGLPLERRQCDIGYIHIGFRVTDIHRHYAEMKAQGIRFLSEPAEVRPGTFIVYFQGPDGEMCEMRQTPA